MTEGVTGGRYSRAWAADLASWAIPDGILAQAPRPPWIHPVELFAVTAQVPDSPSHRRAREALPDGGGSVLDLGCGGGRASFAVAPPAVLVTGVDQQTAMLEAYAAEADRRGVAHREIHGDWPAVADRAPLADVVVAHHVAYNVADLTGFARSADAHARRRVVFELPSRHPLAWMAPLWRHFWDLDRPDGPTADDALAVLEEAGLDAHAQRWQDPTMPGAQVDFARRVEFTRIRLCLPAERDPEVAERLRALPEVPRQLVTLWWDVTR